MIKVWFYILQTVKIQIDRKIELSQVPYVVYFNMIYPEIYICPNGKEAAELVNLYETLNNKLGRNCVSILYGPVDMVFQYKIPRLMDMIFTWDATKEEKESVFNLIIETPAKVK